jgi:hypothetical protein
MLSNGCM